MKGGRKLFPRLWKHCLLLEGLEAGDTFLTEGDRSFLLLRTRACPGLLCPGGGFPGQAFSLKCCDHVSRGSLTVPLLFSSLSAVVSGRWFRLHERGCCSFSEADESGRLASALLLAHCLICWCQGLHANAVATPAREIVKPIMDVPDWACHLREGIVGSWKVAGVWPTILEFHYQAVL